MTRSSTLTSDQVAARLGVKTQTVYAYVSRGLLNPQKGTGGQRSVFEADEVDALRKAHRRTAPGELKTVIATRITHVSDAGLYVRGHDLPALVAERRALTDVIDVLWDAPPDEPWPRLDSFAPHVHPGTLTLLNRLRIAVAECGSNDALALDTSPKNVRHAARALITQCVLALPPQCAGTERTLPDALWVRLAPKKGRPAERRALEAALCLLTDHGLATSTFAARVAASVRGDIYSVVSAGLGALGGVLHGAQSARVHMMFADAERTDAASVLAASHGAFGAYPGTGHSVYTRGDPRYDALMSEVHAAFPQGRRRAVVDAVCTLIEQRSEARPNIDLALGALTYLSTMEASAGEAIFAIARTAGFVAHALEEYSERPTRFRPRARFMGRAPGDNDAE